MYPTEEQKVLLSKHFGCTRWVYNWALEKKIKGYNKETKQGVSIYEIQSELPKLKKEEDTKWLSEVSAQSLQSALHNLDAAFTAFFKKDGNFPNFKSKYRNQLSFSVSQLNKIDFNKGLFFTIKFKQGIKCKFSRQFEGKIKTCTISKTPTNKYYVSILVEDGKDLPILQEADKEKALGIDLGVIDLCILSDGTKFENPKTLKRYMRRLKIRQRRLSKKKKGSKNRDKGRLKVAAIHEKISNIRNDNLHKISHKLVCENQATTLCIEDLSVKEMMGKAPKSLARSMSDAGLGNLRRMIEYKCQWYGKNLKVIGRFEPSSKICSDCGTVNHNLTLADREWTCVCGSTHDRDINAAKNIRNMAFAEHNTSSKPICRETGILPMGNRKVTSVDLSLGAKTKQKCQHDLEFISN